MEFVQPIRTRKEINALKKQLTNQRDRLMVTIGLNSALRISDILSLTVADVFDENGKPRAEIRRVKEKKTGKSKSFPINKAVAKELRKYAKEYGLVPDHPLFFSRKTKNGRPRPIDRTQALRIIKQAAEAAGIKENIGTHSLRKSWAFHSYEAGVPLAKISYALNHSSERETLRYIGITKEDVDTIYREIVL
jgi:integrase